MSDALPLGATIGILGGGQLGRMLSLAASRLGFRTHIFCPDPESPAFEVTRHKTVAAYDDEAALAAFAACATRPAGHPAVAPARATSSTPCAEKYARSPGRGGRAKVQ